MQTSAVQDVSTSSFEQDVVERSSGAPVVVDFWAPWCGPCRALGPLLERLADEAQGAWTLAKVNVDENQELSQRFGIQGIPAVKGFRDGKMVAEFTGAQPESGVRAFLRRLLPSPADLAVSAGNRLLEAGDEQGAEAELRRALQEQPDHAGGLLALGRLLARHPESHDEAEQLLSALPPAGSEGREAAGDLARLRLLRLAQAPTEGATAGTDLDSIWQQAMAAVADGQYPAALDALVGIVQRNRRYRNGGARSTMLDIFAILGPDDPVTEDYQRRLAKALFS